MAADSSASVLAAEGRREHQARHANQSQQCRRRPGNARCSTHPVTGAPSARSATRHRRARGDRRLPRAEALEAATTPTAGACSPRRRPISLPRRWRSGSTRLRRASRLASSDLGLLAGGAGPGPRSSRVDSGRHDARGVQHLDEGRPRPLRAPPAGAARPQCAPSAVAADDRPQRVGVHQRQRRRRAEVEYVALPE